MGTTLLHLMYRWSIPSSEANVFLNFDFLTVLNSGEVELTELI